MAYTQKEKQAALEVVRRVLSEENTDVVIDILVRRIKSKLPFWLRWIPIAKVLDSILPDILIDAIAEALT